jgi:hypothetical protein
MQGIVATGLAWSVFQPLQTVTVPNMAAIFLGDQVKNFGLEHFKLDC